MSNSLALLYRLLPATTNNMCVEISRRNLVKSITSAIAVAAIAPTYGCNHAPVPSNGGAGSGRLLTEQTATYSVGSFLLDLSTRSIRVRHRGDPTRSLWETNLQQPFLLVKQGKANFREHGNPLGSFTVRDDVTAVLTFKALNSAEVIDASALDLSGTLSSSQASQTFRLHFRSLLENQLEFAIEIDGPQADDWNRIVLHYASSSGEAFFGFGQQLTYFNQKGHILPILVQEHGIGRGLPVISQLVDLKYDGAGGTPYLTEAPAPHYITSQLRSLFLENKEYSTFDMRAADSVQITLFASRMTGRILFGRTPLDLIEEYSSYAGRMRVMPDWVHQGVMVAAQGGNRTGHSRRADHFHQRADRHGPRDPCSSGSIRSDL